MIDLYQETLEEYKARWVLTNPKPKRRRPTAMDFIQFILFAPIVIIGPFVSAFRTAALISEHTAFQQPAALFIEACLATFLFEWGVIAFQVQRLRREMGSNKQLPQVKTGWIKLGLVITIGAVATSNAVEIGIDALTQAGAKVPGYVPAIAIGIFIGLGVILITAISGEVVGRFVLEYQHMDVRLREEHSTEVEKWEERFANSWNSQKGKLLKVSDTLSDREDRKPRVSDRATDKIPLLSDKDSRIDWLVSQASDKEIDLTDSEWTLADIVDILDLQKAWGVSQRTLSRYVTDIRTRNGGQEQ
jgi:hypothetical protein